MIFRPFFLHFTASVWSPPPGPPAVPGVLLLFTVKIRLRKPEPPLVPSLLSKIEIKTICFLRNIQATITDNDYKSVHFFGMKAFSGD